MEDLKTFSEDSDLSGLKRPEYDSGEDYNKDLKDHIKRSNYILYTRYSIYYILSGIYIPQSLLRTSLVHQTPTIPVIEVFLSPLT
ncbi:MAG: hypothetical protein [Bacteriophage sp.]|nr:MAG: hypothetical protein [Bacteriophage sp.]